MGRVTRLFLVLFVVQFTGTFAWASGSFICQEPGGKRLVYINDKEISLETNRNHTLLWIDGNNILNNIHDPAILVVDDNDIRHSAAGVKLATFDGEAIRHGPSSDGKVMINYHHPDLCPDAQSNRIYSIEGDAITRQQLVAGLYLLKPDMFKLSDEEVAAQQKAIKEAGEEQDRKDHADQVAGKWMMLNSSGILSTVGKGTITVDAKKGAAYPVTCDFTQGGGPQWTGIGFYKEIFGDKIFWAGYGTPKTVAICVYDIDGGSLKGTWYPWYIDGQDKNTGSEVLKGPESLDGDFNIESAKAPYTGAAYTGSVTIKPLAIVGSDDSAKPYSLMWTIGGAKIYGIGIRVKNSLVVSTSTGTDVSIAKFKIENGNMTSDWFKLGSTEKGSSAATSMNN